MAKRRATSRKTKTSLKRVDHIPKCSQQRRSSPPKRRTDFSLFFVCNWDSISDSGSLLESSCVKIALLNQTLNNLRDGSAGSKETSAQSSKSLNEGSEFSSNAFEASIGEPELANQNALLESHDDCKVLGMEFTPKKSHVAESETACISPPSVESERHWSPEDQSPNSSNGLVKSIAASNSSDEQYLSSDKSSPSISSRTEEGSSETGRGKRKCKPKLHFDDDVIVLEKTDTKDRRLRIMRFLGLTPPIGSPFKLFT